MFLKGYGDRSPHIFTSKLIKEWQGTRHRCPLSLSEPPPFASGREAPEDLVVKSISSTSNTCSNTIPSPGVSPPIHKRNSVTSFSTPRKIVRLAERDDQKDDTESLVPSPAPGKSPQVITVVSDLDIRVGLKHSSDRETSVRASHVRKGL